MQFFTKAWLTGELSDEAFEAAPIEYRLRLSRLRLPADVLALAEADTHDSLLLEMHYDDRAAILILRLRCGDRQRGYFDLVINYSGAFLDDHSLVVLRHFLRNPRVQFLYDEVDREGEGYVHRLILSSHQEICVKFASVSQHTSPTR